MSGGIHRKKLMRCPDCGVERMVALARDGQRCRPCVTRRLNGPPRSAETIQRMREMWEGRRDLSASAIGRELGVGKGVIIGLANRRDWQQRAHPRGNYSPPTTLYQRCDALDARMAAVLAETRAVLAEDRRKRAAAAAAAAEKAQQEAWA